MTDAEPIVASERRARPRSARLAAGAQPAAAHDRHGAGGVRGRAERAVASQHRQHPQPIELSLAVRLGADDRHSDARLRPVAGDRRLRGQRRQRARHDGAWRAPGVRTPSSSPPGSPSDSGSARWSACSTASSSRGSGSVRSSSRSAASTSAWGFRRRCPAAVRSSTCPTPSAALLYNGVLIPGVSIPLTLAIVICLALYFLLDHTTFGRSLYLIGNNPRAAHLAGLPSRRYLAWPMSPARCWRRSAR